MRLLFFGTGDDSLLVLTRLSQEPGLEIAGIVTRPSRPRGRGRKSVPTPVYKFAEERGVPVAAPHRLSFSELEAFLSEIKPETGVVASYGAYIPSNVFNFPDNRTLNIHPSLLPLYRGPAPVRRALFDSQTVTGVTIHYTEKEMDAGDILAREEEKIRDSDDNASLSRRLFQKGAELLIHCLDNLDRITPVPQDEDRATYAPAIKKEELFIDWNEKFRKIEGKVRGLSPEPGARCDLFGETLKIFRIGRESDSRGDLSPGAAVGADCERGILVACGDAIVRVDEAQRPGRKRMKSTELLRGWQPDSLPGNLQSAEG